jgi:cysteine-rich repeat protein
MRALGVALVIAVLLSACGDDGPPATTPDALPDVLTCDAGAQSCDDNNSCTTDRVVSQTACSITCAHDPIPNCCGNSMVEAGESCDDGNQINYDGCSSQCEFERALIIQTASIVPPNQGCDLNGDGIIDNTGSAALNDQARQFLSDFVTNRSFQNNPVVALLVFVGRDQQMLNAPWTAFFLGGADTDTNVTDNFSGSEPFYVTNDTLDQFGQPRWPVTGSAPSGNLMTNLGTLVMTLPNRLVLENEEFAHATLTGNLMANPLGPTAASFRLCGAQTATSFHRIPDQTGGANSNATILDDLALGYTLGGFRITPTQPDFDVDRDGLETFRDTDGDQLIDLCIDGNGTQIQGRDCAFDPRIADGYTIAWDLTAVRAFLAGPKP